MNKSTADKIDAMRKFNQYKFMKTYLDEKVFDDDDELKIGYLNINGLLDGGHAEYLNNDYNLLHLDILILAETKLDKKIGPNVLASVLTNWDVMTRFDSQDEK